MRKFIRSPLTWMVAAEIVVVTLLVFFAWSMVVDASRPALVAPLVQLPAQPPDVGAAHSSVLPDLARRNPAFPAPLPGLILSSALRRSRLAELNRDQVV